VVTEVSLPIVKTSLETWFVDSVIVCSGADFETLYSTVFKQHGLTKCKLQMMRAKMRNPVSIGPSLCAGLTLRHYKSFSTCASLTKVDERYNRSDIRLKENGIHVLVSQNSAGELIIGDSHHYGPTLEPFDVEEVNDLILNYLASFTNLGPIEIIERWHGVYPKAQNSVLIIEPEPNVKIVNGFGGAGMTLSFGIAEKIINSL
jgi:D-hydroxyproline dehydrogenase subunit beta